MLLDSEQHHFCEGVTLNHAEDRRQETPRRVENLLKSVSRVGKRSLAGETYLLLAQLLDRELQADRGPDRGAAESALKTGMSLESVRRLLNGWSDHPVHMVKSDNSNLYHTWDFTPPAGSDRRTVRLTFLNNELVAWGEAATSRRGELADKRTG